MAVDRWVGQVLGGRYKIEEMLGQGGMSAVYKARDPNLQRTVAIKLIHSHLSNNEEFVRRFESEATAVAHLRHPNIVQVFDFNHEGDLYYMVLEYVAGETLQSRIKRLNVSGRRIPIKDALRYTTDVCRAADYAHQRGLIHRDIKPANVILDVSGNAILMDFGIAHMLGGQQHTATGAVLGTALYMSPEQIQGLHPDARADIYSIGVTLFEALGGRPPFEADSVMTLMMMHLNDPVPDLSRLAPGIPESVKAVVEKALEKDRARRFQSGAEMAEALQEAMQTTSDKATAPVSKPAVPETPARPPVMETIIEAAPTPATIVEPAGLAPAATAVSIPTAPTKPAQMPIPAAVPVPGLEYPPQERPAKKGKGLLWAGLAVLLLALGGGGYALSQGMVPGIAPKDTPAETAIAAVLPSSTMAPATATIQPTDTPVPTEAPTATEAPPTNTPEPEPTATPAPAVLPSLGGADMIAYISQNNIWTAGIDGSNVKQITTDGTAKTALRWLPDGQGLSFISGKCIQTAGLDGTISTITCFNYSEYLDAFEVSPDGARTALSLDRRLFLIPFDLQKLAEANSASDLTAMSDCDKLAPYQRNSAVGARWSKDSKTLAVVALGVLADGRRGEIVQVVAVDKCIPNPVVQVQFPQPHFTYSAYNHNPELTGLTWDGGALFALNGLTRNEGFGDLHFFNRETYKAQLAVNPVNGVCCYSGPQFSPDGQYLLFAFQDIGLGAASVTQIYYIPFGTIGSGAAYQPLPLPAFSSPKELPQAVARPAASP